jgi:hypothetical protein
MHKERLAQEIKVKKYLKACLLMTMSLVLANCGKAKDDELTNKIDGFSVLSGSCPSAEGTQDKATVFQGSCVASFNVIPPNSKSAYSIESKINLKQIGAYYQINLNSDNQAFNNGARIRFTKITDSVAQATVQLNNATPGTVASYQMRFVDANDIQVIGTIIPSSTNTRIVFWNMKDAPYTNSNMLFDSWNAGHFTNNMQVSPSEIMSGVIRGFMMQDAILMHAIFPETATIPL